MSKEQYSTTEGEHGPEIWDGDERITYIDESGNWRAAYGKSSEKEAALEWYGDGVGKQPGDFEVPEPAAEEPAAALIANPSREGDAPPVDPEAKGPEAESTPDPSLEKEEEPEIPEKEPRQSPGLGNLTPEYVRYAWHRLSDAEFAGVYGKSKEAFKADHGGFLRNVGAITK